MSNSVDSLVLHHNKLMQNDLSSVDFLKSMTLFISYLHVCMSKKNTKGEISKLFQITFVML